MKAVLDLEVKGHRLIREQSWRQRLLYNTAVRGCPWEIISCLQRSLVALRWKPSSCVIANRAMIWNIITAANMKLLRTYDILCDLMYKMNVQNYNEILVTHPYHNDITSLIRASLLNFKILPKKWEKLKLFINTNRVNRRFLHRFLLLNSCQSEHTNKIILQCSWIKAASLVFSRILTQKRCEIARKSGSFRWDFFSFAGWLLQVSHRR